MKNLKIKEKIIESLTKNREIHIREQEVDLFSASIKGFRGWTQFQEFLKLSDKDPEYWDQEKTQTQLVELANFIKDTFSEIQQGLNQDLKTNLDNFLARDLLEDLEISWDRNYAGEDFGVLPIFEDLTPLYPEDILSILITLDRAILFLREALRQEKYKCVQHQIERIKKSLSPHQTSIIPQNYVL